VVSGGRPDEFVHDAREALLRTFGWSGGHADVWAVLRDADALQAVVRGLAAPFRNAAVTRVAGIESRGFLLGGAVAVELGVGFTPVRKAGALLPGEKVRAVTAVDYRNRSTELMIQHSGATRADRVLLVDDWIETGSQACAVQAMIAARGASLVGISVMVNQLPAPSALGPIAALVNFNDLPPSD
jgi:adenine phosphoribosyltransferase